MGGACSMHGETRNAYSILFGRLGTTRPLERSRSRRGNKIRIGIKEIEQ
jgi:hypothetical protein